VRDPLSCLAIGKRVILGVCRVIVDFIQVISSRGLRQEVSIRVARIGRLQCVGVGKMASFRFGGSGPTIFARD